MLPVLPATCTVLKYRAECRCKIHVQLNSVWKTNTHRALGTQADERILIKQAGKNSPFWQKFWQSCGWTMNAALRPSRTVHHCTRSSSTPQLVPILVCSSYIPWIFSNFPTTFIKTLQIGKSIGFLPQPEALISAITSFCSRQSGNEILCCTILFMF